MIFTTSRLYCRKIEIEDIDQYYSIFGAEDSAEFDEFEPINLDDARSDVLAIIQKPNDSPELELAVCELQSRKMLGVLYAKFETEAIFIGYHFDAQARGQGFASEAVAGFVDYLNVNHDQIIAAKVDSENMRSIKLLERIGFKKDGTYAENQFFKNKARTELLYTLS